MSKENYDFKFFQTLVQKEHSFTYQKSVQK